MGRDWYFRQNGRTYGPISSTKLKQLVSASRIDHDTPVRVGQGGKWRRAETIGGLFPPQHDLQGPPSVVMDSGPSARYVPQDSIGTSQSPIAEIANAPPIPHHRNSSSHENLNGNGGARPENLTRAESVEQFCSICQTSIQAGDPSISCDECHLPFHVECWEENQGCSAYGCLNVNALRVGPDTQVCSPPPLPARSLADSSNDSPRGRSDIPWEYLLLAGSALGTLLGLVSFGVPALMAAAATAIYFAAEGKSKSTAVLVSSLVLSFIGFILGLVLSAKLWW